MAEQQQILAVQQALELAIEHHKADRLPEAEAIYQQLLRQDPNQADAIHMLGVLAHQVGKNELAVELITRAVNIRPNFAVAYCNLGLALQPLGKLEEAADCYQQAITIRQDYAEAHNNLGILHQELQNYEEAVASHSKAIQINPDFAVFHFNLGAVFQMLGDLDGALKQHRRALQIQPDYVDARYNLGLTLQTLRRFDEAISSYQDVLSVEPQHIKAVNNLGTAFYENGNLEEAEGWYRQAITINPTNAEAHNNLGTTLEECDRLEESVASYQQAIALQPEYAAAHYNLANAYRKLNRLKEAITSYNNAISLRANYGEAHCNLGVAFMALGDLGKAVACYQKAISVNAKDAEAHWNLALGFLRQGDWKGGWEEFEWRFKRKKNIRERHNWLAFPIEKWSGSILQEKNIIVYAEQGVGDEIMFSSCIPDLLERSPRKIFLECDPRLEPLFARSFPDVHVCGKKRDQDPSWVGEHVSLDYSLPIGSLPKFFRNGIKDFPSRDAFLAPKPKLVKKWTQRLTRFGGKLKIGISWYHGQSRSSARKAFIPLADWEPLLSMNASFINLQYGDTSEDIAEINKKPGIQIHDWADNDPLNDLDNQAALISALDLVITIDNTTTHMAGAVGTPTWVLLEYIPDWRWPRAFGDFPPLYHSVRLFRQKQLSDWSHVLQEVEQSLKDFIG